MNQNAAASNNSHDRNTTSKAQQPASHPSSLPPPTDHDFHKHPPLAYATLFIWPFMLTLPLALTSITSSLHYTSLFPRHWYSLHPQDDNGTDDVTGHRHPLGLILGISAVIVGHAFLLFMFQLYQRYQLLGPTLSVQSKGATPYLYSEALTNHLIQPGGFLLLGLYLTITWVYNLLPESYYQFSGGIQYASLLQCLVVQDLIQYLMHRLEHISHPKLYRISHKPHHKYTNPKLFDAFDGSVPDTAIMILLPLFLTAHTVRNANVWTYMAFGSSYANWLTLIHSEVTFPWERCFRTLGLGTAADHHVHHKFFRWNYGHLFMWWDWAGGTYRDPRSVWGREFRVGV